MINFILPYIMENKNVRQLPIKYQCTIMKLVPK